LQALYRGTGWIAIGHLTAGAFGVGTMFEVLMPAPMMPMIADGIAQRFPLHRLWEAADREAAIEQLSMRVRAMAAGGNHALIDATLMKRLLNLEIVASFGVGYDHVDAKWAAEHGIIVTNTPDVLDEEVADTAMGLLLSTVRQLPQADHYVRSGQWEQKHFPLTATLRGRTLGIVGLGRIGKAIARRAEAFGLPIAYHGRNRQPSVPYLYYSRLLDLAQAVDILLVITPGGAQTTHLIDAAVLAALGPQGILINVSRGSVVDEAALIDALQTGKILTAGLDVYADEPRVPRALIEMDHVVLLPHVGSASQHTRNAMGQLVVDNLIAYADGKGPITPVVETPWPATGRAAETFKPRVSSLRAID
jgi:lactate dehydrogenase-like 2-hydroxyacid dehydrogenase